MPTPDSWLTRAAEAFLTRDPQMRHNMLLSVLGLAMMAAGAAVMLALALAGHANLVWTIVWAVASMAAMATCMVLVRTRWAARFEDPSLTMPQMLVAMISAALAYVLSGSVRGALPAMMAVPLMFGALELSARQLLGAGLCALVALGAAHGWVMLHHGGQIGATEWASAAMLTIVLCGTLGVARQMQRLRESLWRKKAELVKAYDEIGELAIRDNLTGLINRRHMRQMVELELRRRSNAPHRPILAVLSVDHFKVIVERWDPDVGDQVLRECAAVARAGLRETDLLARWGPGEFILMLLETRSDHAHALLDRLRERVALLKVRRGSALVPVTISVGFAQQVPGESVDDTLLRADRALLLARQDGRNRVVLAVAPEAAGAAAA